MNRPVSPILHDYKAIAGSEARKSGALPWFIAGFGLPLIGIVLFLTQNESPAAVEPQQSLAVPVTETTTLAPFVLSNFVLSNEASDPEAESTSTLAASSFHPPLVLEPEYEKIRMEIARGDTLDRLFRKNGLSIADLAAIVRLDDAAPYLKKLIPGDVLEIEHDDGRLMSLYRELSLTNALSITREDEGFGSEFIDRPIEKRERLAHGRIETSLFESAMAAGLKDALIMNLAGIFAWDVDFVLDIRSGDDYYILYEEIFQDGEYVSDGEIIAAEFNNNGRTFQAIRYIDDEGRSDYFTPDGRSVRKAFVRAPVDFTRISSNFNPNRKHPILNTIRAHRGVDYAAPRGTPVKAAGDGKVIFRGVKSGYGNAVILQHGGNITTLYAHMSQFNKSARVGRRVEQGQIIGYVGMTGLATAPHLHYEYRLNGVHRNPRTVKLPQAAPIAEKYRAKYLATVEPVLDELLQYKRTRVAALTSD